MFVTGAIMFMLSQVFSNKKREDWPTDVNEKEAVRLYTNSRYDILSIVSLFFAVPLLGYLIGFVLVYLQKNWLAATDEALILRADPVICYIIGGFIALGFMFQISDWIYKRVMGESAYKMYLVAQSIKFDMNSFAMQKSYHYFTKFMLLIAFALYVQMGRMTVQAHDTHIEVQHFFALSSEIWAYEKVDSIQYDGRSYKICYSFKNNIYTDEYDQNQPDVVRRVATFIAAKANVKVDTMVWRKN
jgi:phosphate/sulfate permease